MIYEFQCAKGHVTERHMPASMSDVERLKCTECGEDARRIFSLPAMIGFEGVTARTDEAVYREHNVTREETIAMSGGGTLTKAPLSVSSGCKCGNCSSHVRRNAITGTAEPGKVR